MFKKVLSMLLAVMLIASVMTVGFVSVSAAPTAGFTPDPNKLYFDVQGTGWTMGDKNKVAFHIFGGDLEKTLAWGASKSIGAATTGESTVFEIDPVGGKQGYTLTPGVQYKIIFVRTEGKNWGDQTYDLFFNTDCLGHYAYSDGTMTENPVDSSKMALTAYWDDSIDAAVCGPVRGITSIGNVVGTCLESGKTDYDLLKDFFTEEKTDFQGKTCYQNAHGYVCEISETSPNYKTEQKMIDDIGAGLSLTKDDVKSILEDEEVQAKLADGPDCDWDYEKSTLPAGSTPHEHTPGEPTEENVVPATCQHAGSYDKVVYCTTCGEELSREEIVIGKLLHTPGEPVQENFVPATCQQAGGYDSVTYCTECGEEISREHTDIGKLLHTPGEPVIENDHASTCTVQGAYDEVTYCTVCKGEISRETKYHDLAQHTPGEPVQDQMAGYPATCTENGLKVMVTRCTECGTELSRDDVPISAKGHSDPLANHEEVPATATVPGVKAHYECTDCHATFWDAAGQKPATAEELIIPADLVRGDANGDGVFDMLDVTTLQRYLVDLDVEKFVEAAADVDLSGDVDAIDVTLMQRVLAQMTTFEKWDEKHPKAS